MSRIFAVRRGILIRGTMVGKATGDGVVEPTCFDHLFGC